MDNSRGSLFKWLYIMVGVFAVSSSLVRVFLPSLLAFALALPLFLLFPAMMFLAGYYWTDPHLHPDVKRNLWIFGGTMGFFAMVTLLAIVPAALVLHPRRSWDTALGVIVFFSLFPIGYVFGNRKRRRLPAEPGARDE